MAVAWQASLALLLAFAGLVGASDQQAPTEGHLPVYLESMQDLEHVAYLSLLNFNLTDESLVQSALASNSIAYRLYGKASASPQEELIALSNSKIRLALMLESFILHLRNGHLRRLELLELELMATNQLNASTPTELIQLHNSEPSTLQSPKSSPTEPSGNKTSEPHPPVDRCNYLVLIYQLELLARQRNLAPSAPASPPPVQPAPDNAPSAGANSTSTQRVQLDESSRHRLMHLCRLAVECQSAEDLVSLIGGRWREPAALGALSPAPVDEAPSQRLRDPRHLSDPSSYWSSLGFSSIASPPSSSSPPTSRMVAAGGRQQHHAHLRDSLSISVAKLCPLILFQLHDNDVLCNIRRDDRPPMATVWAFATLFVTIVCSCSLIGMAIAPLLGGTTSGASLSSSSDLNDSDEYHERPWTKSSPKRPREPQQRELGGPGERPQRQACLILFEGLAVGSLVGSALFSLIPQAFELQERDSNQSFLLKALIIFFGIYLFYCSERIMRIILDSRQQRKRLKLQLQRRGSNSAIVFHPSAAGEHMMTTSSHQSSKRSRHQKQQAQKSSARRHQDPKLDSRRSRLRRPPAGAPAASRRGSQHSAASSQCSGCKSPAASTPSSASSYSESRSSSRSSSGDSRRPSQRHPRHQHNSSNRHQQHIPAEWRIDRLVSINSIRPPTSSGRFWGDQQAAKAAVDISTVAWMIVIGDGLHNFIDGVSIGAAFSESILSGVSISVAVICEEFPHELGDFAVLVSSGMTVRQALGYNFLSACTCYLGMAFGIIFGEVNEGASYVSALAAGVFLYIALVDMMGELSTTVEASTRGSVTKALKLLLFQNVGIFIGISIIFVLSFIDF